MQRFKVATSAGVEHVDADHDDVVLVGDDYVFSREGKVVARFARTVVQFVVPVDSES